MFNYICDFNRQLTVMNRRKIIMDKLGSVARRVFANIPGMAYLYGSRARGESNKHSDWDILIITDDSLNTPDAYERYAFPFAEVGWEYGEQITPVLFTRSEWEAESNSLFYYNVLSEAIPLILCSLPCSECHAVD